MVNLINIGRSVHQNSSNESLEYPADEDLNKLVYYSYEIK